ncbi:META domain-containing protein [uncultured Tateyamaria sp.]|uniref:META domain-containing protein n=1 Tax=uncultured Tateyamaria sp. TaxID=455651 RepID=UPI0026212FD6|nr:META domain-containing protein [uncultured Tateyamaria sp.]
MTRIAAFALIGFIPTCQADETVARYGAAGVTWTLTTLNGATFAPRATLEFEPGGPMSGQAPCNRFTATNSVPYPWFETGPIAATKMACPDLDAETAYLGALSLMTQSEVRGDTLFLRNDDGGEMVFTASE